MQMYPGWSARDNYAIHKRRKKKKAKQQQQQQQAEEDGKELVIDWVLMFCRLFQTILVSAERDMVWRGRICGAIPAGQQHTSQTQGMTKKPPIACPAVLNCCASTIASCITCTW